MILYKFGVFSVLWFVSSVILAFSDLARFYVLLLAVVCGRSLYNWGFGLLWVALVVCWVWIRALCCVVWCLGCFDVFVIW